MKTGQHPHLRRFLSFAAVGTLAVGLTACTGRGGGQLPPKYGFNGPATFGFSFSCEDKGGINPPTGQLRIQLSYTEHGSSDALDSSFSIHGTVDKIDPVVESMFCSGQEPPPGPPNELIFLGRYRLTSSAPARFPATCSGTTPVCRFEVIVRDGDKDGAPSTGDFFSIKLSSTATTPCASYPPDPTCSELAAGTVFYTRAGPLSSGNLTVD